MDANQPRKGKTGLNANMLKRSEILGRTLLLSHRFSASVLEILQVHMSQLAKAVGVDEEADEEANLIASYTPKFAYGR